MSTLKVDTIQSSTGASPVTINDTLNVAGNTAVTGTLSATSVTDASRFKPTGAPSASEAGLSLYSSGFWLNTPSGTIGYLGVNGSGVAAVTSSGLAVTGTLSATGVAAVGGPTSTDIGLNIRNAALTSTNQYGMALVPTGTSAATNSLTGAFVRTDTAAAAFTVTNAYGVYVDNPSKGAGSSITTFDAFYVPSLSAGGTNYAFRSAGPGLVSIGDATDATSTTAASLKTAGGLGVAKKLCVATSSTTETNQADLIAAKAWIGDAVGIISLSNTTTVYPALVFGKGDTAGSASTLNDVLGRISFAGCTNGVAERVTGAYIRSVVDTGTWVSGANRKSNLEFYPGSALALSMSSAGVVNVATNTDATTTTAAAFTVTGGVGIAKKTYCGDNIVMASGKGIDFSATSNGSGTTTSEVLSDYEEGTWTPVLTAATPGDLSVTYSAQLGTYTKVGRTVTVTFNIATSAFTHTTASGGALITGLPFTAGATYTAYGSGMFNGITKAGYTNFSYEVTASNTRLLIAASASATAQSNAVIGDFPTGGTVYLYGTVTYQI